MRFVHQTRRFFVFAIDQNCEFEQKGIIAHEYTIWFPRYYADTTNAALKEINRKNENKTNFRTIQGCEKWFKQYKDEGGIMDRKFVAGVKQVKTLYDIQTKAVDEISTEDWQLMQKFMRHPKKFEPGDFRVYEDYLANNWRDRDQERFAKSILKAFKITIVGKQRLVAHMRGGPGYGRYFKSRLVEMDIDSAIEMMGAHKERVGLRKILKHIFDRDEGLFVLVPSFYIRISEATKEMIDDIDAGIGGDSSIGFKADELNVVKEGETILYWEYLDLGGSEAMEGSDVWLGSQRGGAINKDASGDRMIVGDPVSLKQVYLQADDEHFSMCEDPMDFMSFEAKELNHEKGSITAIYGINNKETKLQSLRYDIKIWTASDAETHAKDHGGVNFEPAKDANKDLAAKPNNEGVKMKLKIESIGYDKDVDITEDSVSALVGDVELKFAEDAETIVTQGETIETHENTIKDLEPHKEISEAYTKSLVEEIVRFSVFLKQTENDEAKKKEQEDILKSLSNEQLVSQRDNLRSQVEKAAPNYNILPDNTEKKDTSTDKEKKDFNPTPDSRFATD